MNKEELTAIVTEILSGMGQPMVKGSDYKPIAPDPQPENHHFSEGDFVPDVTQLNLRELTGKTAIPVFQRWLEKMGFVENGKLTPKAGDGSCLLL